MISYGFKYSVDIKNDNISVDWFYKSNNSYHLCGVLCFFYIQRENVYHICQVGNCIDDIEVFPDAHIFYKEFTDFLVKKVMISAYKPLYNYIIDNKLIYKHHNIIENNNSIVAHNDIDCILYIIILHAKLRARQILSIITYFPTAAKKYRAASIISRNIEHAWFNPRTLLCKRRLLREFDLLSKDHPGTTIRLS